MRTKKLLIILFIFIINFSIFAISSYGQINSTTIMPDFALGTFPAGMHYEFGVSGLELIPKQTTKLVSKFYTGLEVRNLTQYPVDGCLIENNDNLDLHYYVFVSEGDASFTQSFYRSAKYNNDFLTISIGAKMHWEQAFRVFNIFSDTKNNSIFDNVNFFPDISNPYYGTPDLNGNGSSLTNSLNFGLNLSDIKYTSSYCDGYTFNVNMSLAPWFFANDLPWFSTFSDFIKFNISGKYAFHFLKGETFLGIDGTLKNDIQYQYLSGSAIPKHAQTMSFNGLGLAYYSQIIMNDFSISFVRPKIFMDSNRISLDLTWTEGIGYGTINNTLAHSLGFDHFGSVGVYLDLTLFNLLHLFTSCDYIYDNVKASKAGWSFDFGVYISYAL